jgi:hypothetical protein
MVYKAVDNDFGENYANSVWFAESNVELFEDPVGQYIEHESRPKKRNVKKAVVALKRIFVNSAPSRVHNEIEMLHLLQ